jgi:hypothetical protein
VAFLFTLLIEHLQRHTQISDLQNHSLYSIPKHLERSIEYGCETVATR